VKWLVTLEAKPSRRNKNGPRRFIITAETAEVAKGLAVDNQVYPELWVVTAAVPWTGAEDALPTMRHPSHLGSLKNLRAVPLEMGGRAKVWTPPGKRLKHPEGWVSGNCLAGRHGSCASLECACRECGHGIAEDVARSMYTDKMASLPTGLSEQMKCPDCGQLVNINHGKRNLRQGSYAVHKLLSGKYCVGSLQPVKTAKATDGLPTNLLAVLGLYSIWRALSHSRFDMPVGSGERAARELKAQLGMDVAHPPQKTAEFTTLKDFQAWVLKDWPKAHFSGRGAYLHKRNGTVHKVAEWDDVNFKAMMDDPRK